MNYKQNKHLYIEKITRTMLYKVPTILMLATIKMKLSWILEILGFIRKKELTKQTKKIKMEASKVDFYYSNLINSLVLFAANPDYLDSLGGPVFDPISELETEIDYAFTPILFDEIFNKKLIVEELKTDLLEFKSKVDETPSDLWTWENIYNNSEWDKLRQEASKLLDRIGIKNKVYNDDFTTIYNSKGNIIKESKYGIKE